MKILLNLGKAVITAFFILSILGCENSTEEQMRHIVIFKFKPNTTVDQIKEVTNALGALENKIPGIVSFEHGVNDSPENLNKGFTHVYQFTFEDARARDAYLPHPEHQKFGEMLGKLEIVEDVFVVDFIPKSK